MNKDMKYITVSSKDIKQIGDSGEFEAVIATLNVIDADGDIIMPGAFGDATVSIMPAHNHGSVPLGKAKMQDRGDEAIAVGQFNLDIQPGKEWHSALKFDLENGKSVQEWSFGFRIKDSEEETRDGEPVRILKRLDIIEISPVLRGSGVDTRTLAVKQRFEEQLEQTLDAVSDTLERAKLIAKMRADKDKPKSISDDHKTRLGKVVEKSAWLVAVLLKHDETVNSNEMAKAVSDMLDFAKQIAGIKTGDDELSEEAKVLTDMVVRQGLQHIA